ncbi:RAI1 like PD-XK nuclease-domain-containing protein [Radiomyces spectabilis]|uniref:RAI1 like PD-XK nuclease-domain-containing protein n=1 Tax=Radiomyces spectabilis TaxID=64574 RepID=UPI00221F220C|nr:RAI1 like PD-XK nuclease-domain-containing protein [Radiomyces spectabilis]KAI8374469.1 RAI1 like PD-XK nuclease-domain-containing protein [Radiomyces spectabilis]
MKFQDKHDLKRHGRSLGTFPVPAADNQTVERSPHVTQPKELASFSIDHERKVWFDNRQLKYYYPNTGNDLSVGYEQWITRDPSLMEHLDTLLDALTDTEQKLQKPELSKVDIITWRGIITKIMCTPYTRNEPWELRATRYNGTVYIEEQATEQKKQQESNASERQNLMSYWGYKFESLSTVSKPPKQVQKDDPELQQRLTDSVNINEQYCIVVKTRIGSSSLIIGAEVDCSMDEKPPPGEDPLRYYAELKTSRVIATERHLWSFERYKLMKFWAQSFLVGVPTVICGFRDDDGIVQEVKKFNTLRIPREVRGKRNMWDPAVCLNFADNFLKWVRSMVTVDDPMTTYTIRWEAPFRSISIELSGQTNTFLTQRYINKETSHNIGGPRVHSQ